MVRRKFAQWEYRFEDGHAGQTFQSANQGNYLGEAAGFTHVLTPGATVDNEIQDGVPYSREALAQLSRILGSLPGLSRSFGGLRLAFRGEKRTLNVNSNTLLSPTTCLLHRPSPAGVVCPGNLFDKIGHIFTLEFRVVPEFRPHLFFVEVVPWPA